MPAWAYTLIAVAVIIAIALVSGRSVTNNVDKFTDRRLAETSSPEQNET